MLKYIKNNPRITKLFPLVVILFFFIVTVVFFRQILFAPGIIVGHDWLFPYTSNQMQVYMERPFYTWTYDMNLLGVKNPFFVQMPFIAIVKLFLLIGLNGETLSKVFLAAMFTFSGVSMFLLLRFLGLKRLSATLGGFIFITMPVFFNYSIMGWPFVLLSIGIILPISVIFFIKSVERKNIAYSIVCGLLYGIAILQSQSLVWYPMVFLALSIHLVKDKSTLIQYLKSVSIIILIGLSLHTSWWPNLFFAQDSGVMNSDLVLDTVSQGMRSRLNFPNILRAWGGLFNQFYEITYINYPKFLMLLSFLIPLMAVSSLVVRKLNRKDIRISMSVIFLYMFILFLISPEAMAKIPLSNLVRDTARFTALSSFALAVLASLFLGHLLDSKHKKDNIFGYFLTVLIIINTMPFFSGAVTGKAHNVYDARMRNYKFPEDYSKAENFLSAVKLDHKSYYPPSGTNISIKDQPLFNGDFREIKDPFRCYSPFASTIYMHYSSMGKPTQISLLLDDLFEQTITDQSLRLMGLMGIGDIVIRNDSIYSKTQEKNISDLTNSTKNLIDFGKVKIVKNKFLLPHIYIPNKIKISDKNLKQVPRVLREDFEDGSVIYFKQQNDNRVTLPNSVKLKEAPNVEFKKVNITKYRVVIHKAKESFPIVFSESFHNGWKLYPAKRPKENLVKPEVNTQFNSNYKILDGNAEDQATKEELTSYISQGLVTTLGDGKTKEIKHNKWENDKEKLDYVEKYTIDFVSKDFKGTIQNDNLDNGSITETWFKTPIENNDNHLIANGYANSWIIDTESICASSSSCTKNPDGSYDFEMVLEFWPQRVFYAGLFFSGLILVGSLGYLAYCKKAKNGI